MMGKKYSIRFTKAVASGNDFIIIDDIDGVLEKRGMDYSSMARDLCRRHMSVGADGILVLEKPEDADLKMRVINPDGSEVAMCGNGLRCAALYAVLKGFPGSMTVSTGAGLLQAEVKGNMVRLKMSDPKNVKTEINLGLGDIMMNASFIDSGVPHVVHMVDDIENYPVKETGKKIREHSFFSPGGTNVNFVGKQDGNAFPVRTYERGVEDETLACGTGAVASAVMLGLLGQASSPVEISTRSGEVLTVHYENTGGKIKNVYLEGLAEIVYEGGI